MKIKILRITFSVFKQLFAVDASNAFRVVANGLPADCELLSVSMPAVGIIDMQIRSESFPALVEGCVPEHISPVLSTLSEFVTIS
jgi:hypothetical protein